MRIQKSYNFFFWFCPQCVRVKWNSMSKMFVGSGLRVNIAVLVDSNGVCLCSKSLNRIKVGCHLLWEKSHWGKEKKRKFKRQGNLMLNKDRRDWRERIKTKEQDKMEKWNHYRDRVEPKDGKEGILGREKEIKTHKLDILEKKLLFIGRPNNKMRN